VAAFARLRHILMAHDIRRLRDPLNDRLMVEEFIQGAEFAVEGLLTRGILQPLALFDKPDPLDGPFFEETIYVTPSSRAEEERQSILAAIGDAATALGLWHGPLHAECRLNDRGVFVLEVAARPIGGLCGRSLRFDPPAVGPSGVPAQGGIGPVASLLPDRPAPVSLEELLLRHALGEDVRGFCREAQASGVMMVPIPRRGVYRGVEGVEAARAVAGVADVRITAKADQMLVPLPEGASYLGFIIARAQTPAAVVTAIREAHRRLSFTIDVPLTMAGAR
jgi:hypothetical protein